MRWTGIETRMLVMRLLQKQVNDVDLNKEYSVIIRWREQISYLETEFM